MTPIVRAGIVSMKRDDDTFLIDANVFPGSSGSRAFLRPSAIGFDYKTGSIIVGSVRQPKLIGILSGYIPYTDYAISLRTGRVRVVFEENSGLGIVYSTIYIKKILELEDFQTEVKQVLQKIASQKDDRK